MRSLPSFLTLRRLLVVTGVALVASTLLFCSPGYVVRAGIEEAKILSRRQAIDDVLAAPDTPEETRRKLALVRSARTFADVQLDLDVGDSYTTYSRVERDTLLLVVSAARRDAFRRVTWWFPIVGRVPYKGFFDPNAALAEARKLERQGYDTYVRPAGAFSTLGWFNDPLLSTVLRYDDVSLVSTVIHEVTHNTIFIPGESAFNESFANFVGDMGAIEFFCSLEGDEGDRCRRARAAWSDAVLFADALQSLVGELEAIYARDDLDTGAKIAARDAALEAWRREYEREVVPRLRIAFRTFHERPINNAMLLAFRIYYDRLRLFDEVYRAMDVPLREAVARMKEAAESSPDAPYDAVARLAPRGGASILDGSPPTGRAAPHRRPEAAAASRPRSTGIRTMSSEI